jgi:predicted DNA-binding helix-hairpin-helix protein
MGEMVRVARELRLDHGFRGYIHLKIHSRRHAGAHRGGGPLRRQAVDQHRAAERDEPRRRFAPEKRPESIRRAMGGCAAGSTRRRPSAARQAARFAPAGQSTQMIVGADASDDRAILQTSALYGGYRLKRVYYSAFSPIPDASARCRRPPRRSCASTDSTRPTG